MFFKDLQWFIYLFQYAGQKKFNIIRSHFFSYNCRLNTLSWNVIKRFYFPSSNSSALKVVLQDYVMQSSTSILRHWPRQKMPWNNTFGWLHQTALGISLLSARASLLRLHLSWLTAVKSYSSPLLYCCEIVKKCSWPSRQLMIRAAVSSITSDKGPYVLVRQLCSVQCPKLTSFIISFWANNFSEIENRILLQMSLIKIVNQLSF